MIEPLLLFESILVEDRSVLLLVDSRYAYRSDELEAWYRRPEDPFGGRVTTVLTEVALSHPFRNKAAQDADQGERR